MSTLIPGKSNNLVIIEQTLVTQAAAFAANDLVASKITLENAVEQAGDAGELEAVVLTDLAKQSANMDLLLFDTDPSNTTFTLNSALTLHDTDILNFLGFVQVTSYAALAASSVGRGEVTRPIPFVLAASTSLFGALITRGTPTYGTVSDLTLRAFIRRR